METVRKIKVGERDMFEITCEDCRKIIIAFGENQALQNMKMHKMYCKEALCIKSLN